MEQGFKEMAPESAPPPTQPPEETQTGPPPGVVWNNGTIREIGKAPTPQQLQAIEKRFLAAEDLDD